MTEENKEVLDAEVQDDVSTDSDNNDTLNKEEESDDKDYKTLYTNQKARAEKAEGKLKGVNASVSEEPKEKEEKEVEQKGLSREEAILFAKGLSEEEINKASKIATLEGISLTEATQDEIFTVWKASNDKKAKSEKAELGTSKGSPKVVGKKDFNSPDLSDEDHKKLFQERQGK